MEKNITKPLLSQNSQQLQEQEQPQQWISNDVRFLFEVAVMLVGNGTMSIVGIVGNCINLVVFAKSGFKETVNMLFGLAFADLLSLLTVFWCCVCYALGMVDPPDLPFDPLAFWYVTAAWPHLVCTRLTCWVTALVAVERCLCVKYLVTPKRIACILVAIFTLLPSSYIPIFCVHTMKEAFDPEVNRTRIVAAFARNRYHVVQVSYYINDVALPTLSIAIVLVCTFTMTRALSSSAKWKQDRVHTVSHVVSVTDSSNILNSAGSGSGGRKAMGNKPQQAVMKEVRVAKMVQFISAMFVVCFSPCVLLLYIRFGYPEIGMWREQHNMYVCLYGVVFFMEISNSSLNFFVYLHFNTNFKKTFDNIFNRQ
ncbi:chemosensory receptor a [Plakobranchus ocellatus]|uniref:Chemosensory receptor a n=1 Tax=Plakobranchus ocellatus TaxID=259542 RepID=A0AAV4DZ33_9GAST|nr:chemosensory receptor a [Plakobranchus ocellatus]